MVGSRSIALLPVLALAMFSVTQDVLGLPFVAEGMKDGADTVIRVAAPKLDVIVDDATGVRIGIPTTIVGPPKKAQYGRNWEAGRRRLSIDTLLFDDQSLAELYDRFRKVPRRIIKRGAINADEFALEGTEDDGETIFYVKGRARGDEVRGLSVVYSRSARQELEEVVSAVIKSFDPFPDHKKISDLPLQSPEKRASGGSTTAEKRVAELEQKLIESQRRLDELKKRDEDEKRMQAWEKNIRQDEQEKAKKAQGELLDKIMSARKEVTEGSRDGIKPYGLPQGKRVALVVGVNTYVRLDAQAQLKTARNDALEVKKALESMGFEVKAALDADRGRFYETWHKFLNDIQPGSTTAFFFAGHGMQISQANFLLPADVPDVASANEGLMQSVSINFNRLRDQVFDRRPTLSLFILDACRSNPYKTSTTRALASTRGLARVEPGKGTFVMYSAEAGEEALDGLPSDSGQDKNSVYTRRLVPLLMRGDMTLQAAAQRVRAEVQELASKIRHSQTPAYYDGLVGLVCLSTTCSKSAQVLGRE